jgi:hypothetical protein
MDHHPRQGEGTITYLNAQLIVFERRKCSGTGKLGAIGDEATAVEYAQARIVSYSVRAGVLSLCAAHKADLSWKVLNKAEV